MPTVTEPLLGNYGSVDGSHGSVSALRKEVKYISMHNLILIGIICVLMIFELYSLYQYYHLSATTDVLLVDFKNQVKYPMLIVDEYVNDLKKPVLIKSIYIREK